ncbi:MAG: hypothetical protein GF390_01570 [Candidatus Pacebacteria bacterium]|nr:hypothetical protein [Candidatus Paceibacterota bacterium]
MPEAKFSDKKKNVHMSLAPGKDGKIYSRTGLGYSLALIPAVMMEDFFLRLANTQPLAAFPLQSDWPVLLFASMTNAVFGALLTIVLYLYLRSFKLNHKISLISSFLAMITTNLFAYTKHVYPHMMFASFLTLAFYFLRKAVLTKQSRFYLLAGLAYGVVIITYNPTYLLAAPALVVYYFVLKKPGLSWQDAYAIFKNGLMVLLGILPFWLTYLVFNIVRFTGSGLSSHGNSLSIPKPSVNYIFFEGIWGVLFSPGRSIFVYSPLLLLLILFWWKIPKKIWPEILSFSLLTLIYVYFIGTNVSGGDFLLWHGEMSWGNRYMLPILPFLWIIITHIFTKLSKWHKLLVFLPLTLLGLYVQLLGVLLPYQLKVTGLPLDIWFKKPEEKIMNYGEYPNFLPRYSAVYRMTRTMIKRLKNLDDIYDHGDYNLRLIDGFDYVFDLGWAQWRETLPTAYVLFDNPSAQPVKQLSLQFRNHQIKRNSTYSAQLKFFINEQELNNAGITLAPNQEQEVQLKIPTELLKNQDNLLKITPSFLNTDLARLKKKQVVFLQFIKINNQVQNIETIDFPYVSPVSQALFDVNYRYWGIEETNPWEYWHMHTKVFENTFDLWWLRPIHYWDLPKDFFLALFGINVLGLGYFGYFTWRTMFSFE